MDMNKFNSRQLQEDGIFVPLCWQWTGEVIGTGDDAPGFLVRGIAAKSVQMRLAEASLAAKQSAQAIKRAKVSGKTEEEIAKAVLEDMHANQIEAAMKYIIEARNMTLDEVPVKTPDQIRAVLNMTFPDMQVAKDADGKPMWTTMKDEDGNDIIVPQFEVVGSTYAGQVIAAAENQRAFLDRRATG